MNDNPNIDELLRQRLYAAEVPPPPFVWPEVERALQRRRRRLIFWISGASGVGLLLLALLAFHWQQTGTAPTPATVNDLPAPPITRTPGTAVEVPTDNAKHISPPSSDKAPSIRAGEVGSSNETHNSGDTRSDADTRNSNTVGSLPSAGHRLPSESPLHTNLNNETPKTETSDIVIHPLDASAHSPSPVPKSYVTPEWMTTTAALGGRALPLLVFHRPAPTLSRARLTVRKKKEKQQCYDFAEHPNVWFLDAYAGPTYGIKQLSASPDDIPYLHRRQDSEQPLPAFSAGIRASMLLRQHFLLRTGIHYDQVTEKFEYSNPLYAKYLVEITVTNGQTQIDTLGVDFGEYYTKVFNRYGFLEIPLQGGIELRRGRSGFSVNAGASLNVLFRKSGQILPAEGEPFSFNPNDEPHNPVFRTRAGLSLMGSVQWFYHLQPRTRIFVEPYYRHILQPLTIGDQAVQVRYGIGGINVGMTRILDF